MLVVLPFYSGDAWLATKNLEWANQLDGTLPYECILSSDSKTDSSQVLALAKTIFTKVSECKYDRVQYDHWPFAQNNAFCQTARFVERFKQPWFWWEVDSVPIRKGWLAALEAEYLNGKKPFGGHWNPDTGIFNGVAIYPSSVPRYSYRAAMCDLLEPRKMADGSMYQPPWDFYCSSEVFPHLHIMNALMQHVWDVNGKCPTFPDDDSVKRILRPGIVLFHRCKDGSLIERLSGGKDLGRAQIVAEAVHVKQEVAAPAKRVEILLVSYFKDVLWAEYCLKSINRFATGFSGITVVVPRRDRALFKKPSEDAGAKLKVFDEVSGKGHLHHEIIKCRADEYCQDVDYILHIDSDSILREPITPDDYLIGEKPVILMQAYEDFKTLQPNVLHWQRATKIALGFEPEYEFMRQLPLLYPRWLYRKVRDAVEAYVSRPFDIFVLSRAHNGLPDFSEFNALGAIAYKNHHAEFEWIDCGKNGYGHQKLIQFWSQSPPDKPQEIWLDGKKIEIVPIEMIQKVLA